MISKASGRSALILLAGLGLGLCIAAPLHAAEGDASAADAATTAAPDKPIALNKFTRHHRTHVASAKSRKSAKADKKDTDKTAAPAVDADTAKNETPANDTLSKTDTTAAMPNAVANANAQWPTTTAPETPQTMSTTAGNVLQGMGGTSITPNTMPATADAQPDASAQVAPADQVNDLDLAATDNAADNKPALTLATATIDPPAAVTSGSSTLDQTSLIGKIFIAFGGLLTVASAARMLIA